MLNRSAGLAMSTSVLKALPGKLDIRRHSLCFFYVLNYTLKISECDPGFTPYEDSCYRLFTDPKSWGDAMVNRKDPIIIQFAYIL